jgi:hypothetical protein
MNESQLQLDALESLSLAKSTEGEEKAKMSTLFENNQLNIKITQTDKDSDDDDDEDDLIPYDLSNDVPLVKTNQPAYLRDCLDGKSIRWLI